MASRRKLTRTVAALTAGALALAFGTGTGHADSYDQGTLFGHLITTSDGTEVTCDISSAQTSISRTGITGPFVGFAATGTLPENNPGDPCDAGITEDVTFRNSSGKEVTTEVFGQTSIYGVFSDVGSAFSVQHQVRFIYCIESPTSSCVVTFTTAPK